jgi:tripartite-type tricarboxylate transporter receptor subunit TctC
VIDNKGGAGGTIGAAEVARSSADGYTLLFTTSSTHAISPHLMKVPYKDSDFTPIAHVADAPLVLLVPSSLNVKTVSDFIALARREPGQLHYSTSGNGTISHLTMEDFRARTDLDIVPVPYKGGGPAMQDLMGGSVQALFSAVPGVMGLVKSGRIRAIGITSLNRSPLARDIPTLAESGVPGFSSVAWFGFYGPRSLDPAIVARINSEINKLLKSPELISALAAQGAEPGRGSPSDFAAMVAKDSEHWAKIIRDRKITLQ